MALARRMWGDSSKHPPFSGGGWGVPGGGLSPLHKKQLLCFVQARKMPALLPDIIETLPAANTNVTVKALVVIANVICLMKWEEANRITLRLVEKLLLLFDDVRLLWLPELR